MNREERADREEYKDEQELESETLMRDQELGKRPYPSDLMPEDHYQYKKFINLPESQSEFGGLIDKDVVFANLSGKAPSVEQLSFQAVTIQWTKELFNLEVDVYVNSKNPKEYYFNKNEIPEGQEEFFVKKITRIFDQEAQPLLNILTARYKFGIVSSRATGDTRASMLDTMTQTVIKKELSKSKDGNKKFGL